METFRLIVDRKVEVWRRDNVSIEAESLEEAVNKAIEHDYLVPDDSEYLYDTEYTMSPEQVVPYNSATIEIMDEYGNILKDNYGGGQFQSDT